ncbi:response regulator [Paenibacillus hexagrammi]|uniref:Response regulator n=1 Tax=Paenibacillus hexagrammi TaxID=2908839 RepID=A0ABY3SEQ2_9BACL|nr:response regulator [Paenibacillus sp. YPD9-1]UJF31666.1 response regulator [Paenibacillus sp. YPD9-1]
MTRIMIVDDTPLMRSMLTSILSEHGFHVVHVAVNGQEAVDMYPIIKPDGVIMDVSMPELDGVEALKLILEKDPAAKIIMCSTFAQQSFILRALEIGAKDFIAKPFTPFQVVDAVKRVFNKN